MFLDRRTDERTYLLYLYRSIAKQFVIQNKMEYLKFEKKVTQCLSVRFRQVVFFPRNLYFEIIININIYAIMTICVL